MAKSYRPAYGTPLGNREVAVCQMTVNGLSNIDIAERLDISSQTVKVHLKHAYVKLGINRRIELTRFFAPEYVAKTEATEADFSEEEIRILDLIASGLTDQEVAEEMTANGGIPQTPELIRPKVSSLRRKTGIKTRMELAIWWMVRRSKLMVQPENAPTPYEMFISAQLAANAGSEPQAAAM